jgi:hypothetical protein
VLESFVILQPKWFNRIETVQIASPQSRDLPKLTKPPLHSAEDNPANDYPEQELSDADEEDDPTAVYRRYRHHGSDDEDIDDGDENDYGLHGYVRHEEYDDEIYD